MRKVLLLVVFCLFFGSVFAGEVFHNSDGMIIEVSQGNVFSNLFAIIASPNVVHINELYNLEITGGFDPPNPNADFRATLTLVDESGKIIQEWSAPVPSCTICTYILNIQHYFMDGSKAGTYTYIYRIYDALDNTKLAEERGSVVLVTNDSGIITCPKPDVGEPTVFNGTDPLIREYSVTSYELVDGQCVPSVVVKTETFCGNRWVAGDIPKAQCDAGGGGVDWLLVIGVGVVLAGVVWWFLRGR